MKRILLLMLCMIIIFGCTTIDTSEYKSKLKQCYEEKCELVIEEADLTLDYPFEFCYYESRKECIDEVSEFLDLSFCKDFTYKKLCYEDLAVLKRDKEICYEANKPSKDDELFKEFIKQSENKNEDELFEEYSKAFEEYSMEYNNCNQYYDMAIRVTDSSISHCDTLSQSTARRCYIHLIANFENVEECDKYRDLLKHENYGIEQFELPFNQCYWWYAATHDNIDVCKNLEDREQRDECLLRYATAKRNSEFCQDIEHSTVKEVCNRVGNSGVSGTTCIHTHEFGEMCFEESIY